MLMMPLRGFRTPAADCVAGFCALRFSTGASSGGGARERKGVFVAATKQHVGKTSTSLGILSGLTKRFDNVGFIKPVGQQHLEVEGGLRVDKDVKLAKEFFGLKCGYEHMSPVVIPSGYTKKFIDGEITENSQIEAILSSYNALEAESDYIVVEGTGHTGVGSVVNMNNARVAALLGLDMVLIANGGLGSSFDELALNRAMCQEFGVRIRGVVINKVIPSKMEMVGTYYRKLLAQWDDVPLLGLVPDHAYLGYPSMHDFCNLFGMELLSGESCLMSHYSENDFQMITSGLRRFLKKLESSDFHRPIFVTHASRNDVILGILAHANVFEQRHGKKFEGALILTGEPPEDVPQPYIVELLKTTTADLPLLFTGRTTIESMRLIEGYTAKLNTADVSRTASAAEHYEKYIDFERLLAN